MDKIRDVIVHEADKKAFVVIIVTDDDTPHPVSRDGGSGLYRRQRGSDGAPRSGHDSGATRRRTFRAPTPPPRDAPPRRLPFRDCSWTRAASPNQCRRPAFRDPDSGRAWTFVRGSRPGSASLAPHCLGSRVEGAPVRPTGKSGRDPVDSTAPNATLDRDNSRRAMRRSLHAAAPNRTHETLWSDWTRHPARAPFSPLSPPSQLATSTRRPRASRRDDDKSMMRMTAAMMTPLVRTRATCSGPTTRPRRAAGSRPLTRSARRRSPAPAARRVWFFGGARGGARRAGLRPGVSPALRSCRRFTAARPRAAATGVRARGRKREETGARRGRGDETALQVE
jgi:hypothetical protein